MKNDQKLPNEMNDPDALDALLCVLVEEGLTDSQHEQLATILRKDQQSRDRYLGYMRLHALLEIRHSPPAGLPVDWMSQDATASQDDTTPMVGLLAGYAQQAAGFLSLATPLSLTIAALVMVGTLATMSLVYFGHEPIAGRDTESQRQSRPLVGRVAVARNCVASNDSVARETGDLLYVGDVLSLERGLLQITTNAGAKVLLQAPVRLRLDEAGRFTLLSGSLSVHVLERARGFTIDTKSARLVDFGTRFGVRIEPSEATIVRVTQGMVEASPKDHKGDADMDHRVLVRSGQALRIDLSGITSEILSSEHTFAYADELEISDDYRRWRERSEIRRRDPDLVAYYTFEESDATGDQSGLLHNKASGSRGSFDGRLGNGVDPSTRPRWTVGRWPHKGALRLDTSLQQRVFVGDWSKAGIDREITVAAWFRPMGDQSSRTLVSVWSQNSEVFHFSTRERGLALRLSNDGIPGHGLAFLQAADGKPIARREGWVHVAFTLIAGGGPVRLYKNGESIDLGGATYTPSALPRSIEPLMIGGKSGGGSGFTGLIDELSIYRRALSAKEIARLAEVGKPNG